MPTALTKLRDDGRLAVTPLADEDLMYIVQPAQSPKSRAVKWSALLAELRGAGVATVNVDLSTSDVTLDISTNKTEELVILISGTHKLTLSGAPLKNTSITVISAAVAPGSEPRLALSAAYHGPAYLDAKAAAIPFHATGGFVRYYARPDGTWQGALGVDFGDGSDQVQALASSLTGIFTALTGADSALGNRCTALEAQTSKLEMYRDDENELGMSLSVSTPANTPALVLPEGTWEVSAGIIGAGVSAATSGEVSAVFVGDAGVTLSTSLGSYMTVPGLSGHGSCNLSPRIVTVVGTGKAIRLRMVSDLSGIQVTWNVMARRIL